jgi:GDP-mannose 4,6-dehydratase
LTVALITGISGFVGSHLLDFLIDNTDWDVVGMVRWRSPLDNIQRHVPAINRSHRIRLVYADLRDAIAVDRAVEDAKPDYVFHLAAQSYPRTSFDSPLDTFETNINGTAHVCEAIRRHAPDSVSHICASSEVFGLVPADKLPIDEDCSFHPASPYAISKAGTDLIGRFYGEAFGLKMMTTRMFTHTAARRGDVFAESTFAKQIAMIEAGQAPPIVKVGNLDSVRTLADVRDAVRAYYLLVTVNPIPGAYYNIGGSHTCSVKDILDTLLAMSPLRSEIHVETDPNRLRPIDAVRQVPDCSKFKAHTGWEPTIPFEATMRDLLEDWRDRVKTGGYLTR